jgi:D-alanyl-D-alanine carboxypeptidase/D-alanyl-D-alanine-endopeptidase (penicillin-binding protein 4)
MTKTILLTLLACAALPAETLGEKIAHALDASPAARSSFWGVTVVDLKSGETLYETNANRFFVPASNVKLFTTALALARLGAERRFTTTVRAAARPDPSGIIRGEVRLVGGGDPNLSARALPYRPGSSDGNPLAAIEDLAAQMAAAGVRRVEGDIVGDDTWYVFAPYPEGWGVDDPQYEYGAPVSALAINDNAFTLRIEPGAAAGDPAALQFRPPLEFFQVDNRIRTVAVGERKIRFDRDPGGSQLRLWGSIPARDRGTEMLLGVEDPALYAAAALRSALAARGVTVTGSVGARHLLPNQIEDLTQGPTPDPTGWGFEIARRVSAPLVEDLRVTDKVSQNLHAEMALRAVARARRGVGSREAGVEEMKLFLDEVGAERTQYNLVDGSGLARLNLVTASTVMKLLQHMYARPDRESWIGLLPVAGEDGTLSSRMGGTPASGRVHAKTGSLSHVAALSGYIERANGDVVAFSMLVNNFNGRPTEVRGVMDKICNLIVE